MTAKSSASEGVKWVTEADYSWKCRCGKPGFVIAFESDYPCMECWLKRRKKT